MRKPSLFAARSGVMLVCLLIPAFSAAGQRLVQGIKAVKTDVPGFPEAYCSFLTGNFRVCKTRTSEQGDADYIIQMGEARVNRIEAPAWANAAVSPDGFFAYRGDLDKDGSREIVLVSLEGVSNGMGVTYSTAYIFDGKTAETHGPPISFSIQEFGERENFVYDPRTRRTHILISYWAAYDSIEPKRDMGTYLVGKWFRYRDNRLEPVFEKPTMARRFLNSFAAERDNGWFENRKPYTWLKDRRTHKFFREPAEVSKLARVQAGTIRAFDEQQSANREDTEFEFLLDDGQIIKGKVGRGWTADEAEKAVLDIRAVGLWEARYLYPISFSGDFRPTTFLDRIRGRKVRLETYLPDYGIEFTRVWLLD